MAGIYRWMISPFCTIQEWPSTFSSTPWSESYRSFRVQILSEWQKSEMATLRKLWDTRKDERMLYIHFNKNCECGELINEKLLPEKICARNESELFEICVDALTSANYHPAKFGEILKSCVGNYGTKNVSDRKQLKKLLKALCSEFNACQNFITEKPLLKCPHCETDDDTDDDTIDHNHKPALRPVSTNSFFVAFPL